MLQDILFLSIAILTSFSLTWLIRLILIKKNIIDIPNHRSSHKVPTPRGGGIAIVITWFSGLIYLYFKNQIESELFYALLSGIVLVIIGVIDDIFDIKPVIRIGAQITATALALLFLGGLERLSLGFYEINIGWLLTIIAFFGIIWFINLYNFLDGIDGYASMQAIFISLSFFYFNSSNYYLLLAAATLGFIIWNWQPAKIFMGDVGSTLLGFNFAIFAIYEQNTNEIPLIIFLILSSLFWFDASMTLFRRYKNKEKLSQAHRKHAYQRIVQFGYSHQKTVLFAICINLILFFLAIIAFSFYEYILIPLFISTVILSIIIKKVDKLKSFE